jgi:two-component system, NarL family, sensor histidine kinase UhpB
MWRSISLRNRLNIIFGSLLALWLMVDVGRILVEASERARAETQNAMRLTKDFVATTLERLQDTTEPERTIEALLASLENVRHVRVGVGEPSFASAIVLAAGNASKAPRWFRALVNAPNEVVAIPIAFNNRRMNSIVIVADSSDVIDEAWDGARDAAFTGAALAVAALAATNLLIGRALKPLDVAGATLARLEAGDYAARAEGGGPPEIVTLNAQINSLAGALGGLDRANAELMERAVDAHDQERRVIAHELHDEFGPHLFALRASASVLSKKLAGHPEAQAAVAISSQVEALQNQNRRILANLRPAALEELGLNDAIAALIADWRRTEPAVVVSLDVDPRVNALGDRASRMAYRFVQEALTNAFRHARATRIDVTLKFDAEPESGALRDPELSALVLRVEDNGRGLMDETGAGMGLAGMRDRVRMLGGDVRVSSPPGGGLAIEARFAPSEAQRGREDLPAPPGSEAVESSNNSA